MDLREAFTASSASGAFLGEAARDGTVLLSKFGVVRAGDVPFDVLGPDRTPAGKNLAVLKGGNHPQPTAYPQRVEVKAPPGLTATKLHFLSGVGGWAYPWGESAGHKAPALKVTVHFAGGGSEEFTLHNGKVFVDYVSTVDVPGSKPVRGVVKRGEVRHFELPLKQHKPVEKLVLESFDNHVAPVVAVTAELAEAAAGH